MKSAHTSTHPTYSALESDWVKFRLTYEGGQAFIEEYLQKLSVRESDTDFAARKKVTYCPSHAKAALNDIKNALFQRAVDIKRTGGPMNFLMAADGTDPLGVDNAGNTMNSFIGRLVLPELLSMAKVGIWVDKPDIEAKTKNTQLRPYIYMYRAEDIRNWAIDSKNRLVALILRDQVFEVDEDGLPTKEVERYRFSWIENDLVKVQFYDKDGNAIDKLGKPGENVYDLKIPEIPFAMFEIGASLLTEAADYQIALLNLASADMSYALKSNYPFYTEQYNPNMELGHLLRGQNPGDTGTGAEAQATKAPEARVGVGQGRRYPTGTERPQFINPSPEPLRVSMEKQEQMVQEIRRLINLNVTNIKTVSMSQETKNFDERGLEAGLSYIALELEYGERRVAQIWSWYEGSAEVPTINYPERYSIKTDEERNKEAEELEKSVSSSPSISYKKAAYKEAVMTRIGHKISADALNTIMAEIDKASEIVLNPDLLYLDIENGLVSPQLASKIRGYPESEYAVAAEAHAERLTRIAIAQTAGIAAAPRGVKDVETDHQQAVKDKKKDPATQETAEDQTRGKGRKVGE